jgi:hypothetical protein
MELFTSGSLLVGNSSHVRDERFPIAPPLAARRRVLATSPTSLADLPAFPRATPQIFAPPTRSTELPGHQAFLMARIGNFLYILYSLKPLKVTLNQNFWAMHSFHYRSHPGIASPCNFCRYTPQSRGISAVSILSRNDSHLAVNIRAPYSLILLKTSY